MAVGFGVIVHPIPSPLPFFFFLPFSLPLFPSPSPFSLLLPLLLGHELELALPLELASCWAPQVQEKVQAQVQEEGEEGVQEEVEEEGEREEEGRRPKGRSTRTDGGPPKPNQIKPFKAR
jgi:hypothetical protein